MCRHEPWQRHQVQLRVSQDDKHQASATFTKRVSLMGMWFILRTSNNVHKRQRTGMRMLLTNNNRILTVLRELNDAYIAVWLSSRSRILLRYRDLYTII
jgi:hypothetical protein